MPLRLRAEEAPFENIERKAATILAESSAAADAILTRREKLDRKGLADKPLIVLAGESHTVPAHKIHLMRTLKSLRAQEPDIAVSAEIEYNFLARAYEFLTGEKADENLTKRLLAEDKDGQRTLQALQAIFFPQYSPHSDALLNRFLLQENIPFCPADVAMCPEQEYVDYRDSLAARSMKHCFNKAVTLGPLTASPDGIRARNHHMAVRTIEFAKLRKERIVVLTCGRAHVNGDRFSCRSEHSLAAQFKKQAVPILAMVPVSAQFPVKGNLHENEQHHIAGLPATTAAYDPIDNMPLNDPHEPQADLECREDEAAYTHALLEHIGLTDAVMSIDNHKAKNSSHVQAMERYFKNLQMKL